MNELFCPRCGSNQIVENHICETCGFELHPHPCPVCGEYLFPETGSFDICEVCGWEDDAVQEDNPDEEDCANHMSLNQAKAAYARGEEIE